MVTPTRVDANPESLSTFLARPVDPADWGPWSLARDQRHLVIRVGRQPYRVDLRRCDSKAEMVDVIMHVAGKPWATDTVLAGLVRALDDVAYGGDHDPLVDACGNPS